MKHPELFRENGRVMNLTYSLSLKDAGFDANGEMVEIEVRQQEPPATKTENLKR